MGRKRKARSWDEIETSVQEEILSLRKKEIEFKKMSGYPTWIKSFTCFSLAYAFSFYKLYIKKTSQGINYSSLFFLFLPIVSYGFMSMHILFDKEAFRNYYLTHIELNRIIKNTSQSNEYK
jgi:hypothetical protein